MGGSGADLTTMNKLNLLWFSNSPLRNLKLNLRDRKCLLRYHLQNTHTYKLNVLLKMKTLEIQFHFQNQVKCHNLEESRISENSLNSENLKSNSYLKHATQLKFNLKLTSVVTPEINGAGNRNCDIQKLRNATRLIETGIISPFKFLLQYLFLVSWHHDLIIKYP